MWWLLLLAEIVCIELLMFNFSSFICSSSLAPLCHPHQSSALLQFKSSFSIDTTNYYASDVCHQNYPKTTSWENGTDCCSWLGVTCDTMSGHVIGLDLSCSGLEGQIHPNTTLFHLTHFQRLNLAFNNFSGSQLSSQFGKFVNLTHFNLSASNFEGAIPSEISHLSKLVSLDLSANPFYLRMEQSTWTRFMQNLTALQQLFLDGVDMSSIRPRSLSLLMNLSSTLVTLNLKSTGMQGTLSSDVLCLPHVQKLSLSNNFHLQGQLPNSKCNTSLSILDLSNTGLYGELPDSIVGFKSLTHLDLHGSYFQGPMPPSFSNLSQLTYLRLSLNNFNGQIPSSLLASPHLTFLDVSENKFSGQIPDGFNQSSKLQYLNFAHNNIGGELPWSLSNLVHLTCLNFSWNNFVGHVGDVFGELRRLKVVSLANNNFTGQLPLSLFDLPHLSSLDCSFNKLVGPLPNKITGFSNLTELYMHQNLLNGTLPSWCLSLPSLRKLWLNNNQFTGRVGTISSPSLKSLSLCDNKLQGNIPQSIFNSSSIIELCLISNNFSGHVDFHLFSHLQNLRFLRLSGNNLLSFYFDRNVTYSFPNLKVLDLSSCNITHFPELFGNFPLLQYLDLSNNRLHGEIPKWLRDLEKQSLNILKLSQNQVTSMGQFEWKNFIYLDLSFNLLTGDISSSFCNATSLQILNLSHNNFTGSIPSCLGNLPSLLILDLQMNKIEGTLPERFSKKSRLRTVSFSGNQLEGPLRQSLSNCKQLEVLNLGNNQINDSFPYWLDTLPRLRILILRANKFHGPIMDSMTKHTFPNLTVLDLSNNNFTGPLPTQYISNLTMMKLTETKVNMPYLTIDYKFYLCEHVVYDNSMTITIKGLELMMVKVSTSFATLDLSQNMFEGEIARDIGLLYALKSLNLSHNKLIGPIPQSLGNLTNLESLDLSSNMLTAEIPIVLTNLNFLSVLNLSQNHLVGAIPQGKQFNTFTTDSYKVNDGLCGFPLPEKCNKDSQEQSPFLWTFHHEHDFGFGWKPVALGYGCGIILGCCVFSRVKAQWLVRIVSG
ncbi:hypothetical protein VNO77_12924 [Canavalia gladiata]|uniref:Leucine-rich repeat-containing N-terminal plant-type domain-containing protein n=1 Tax=Canavalia gladiata TaxID=3824 RepID=A0AAN9QQ01_CANGL